MITAEQVRKGEIRKGQTLYLAGVFNSDGTPQRWRVTSIKTWKTRPNEFRLGLKHGLYTHDTADQDTAYEFHTTEQAARADRKAA